MKKSDTTVKVAVITGVFLLLATIIGVLPSFLKNNSSEPSKIENNQGNTAIVNDASEVTINQSNSTPESQLTGLLMPSNEPDPYHKYNNNIPKGAFKIYLGDIVTYVTEIGKCTVIKIGGKDIVSIRKASDGMSVSATVIREDGRIVATLLDNKFDINPKNYFELKRKDKHELAIFDKTGECVLYARFINENAIRFEGDFRVPGFSPVSVYEDSVLVGGVRYMNDILIENFGASLVVN